MNMSLPYHLALLVLFLPVFAFARDLDLKMVTNEPPPTVHLKQGFVEGRYYKTKDGIKYACYLGIPYAEKPIGDLRWENPRPIHQWEGNYTAATIRNICVHHLQFPFASLKYSNFLGDEDCLYLDVFTPSKGEYQRGNSFNVLVYIPGEEWSGAVHVVPTLLLERDMIVVTINYRVNIFGFLSTEDEVLPGNYGLKDQALALSWVKHNIAEFGGNPESITLLGYSAGAASVHYHYLSPMSKGLFNKGISVSGTATCPWAFAEESFDQAVILAKNLHCPTENTKEMVRCLKSKDMSSVFSQISNFTINLHSPFSPFGPVIERHPSHSSFLVEHPVTSLKHGRVQNLPWLTTITTHEGLYPAAGFLNDDGFLEYLRDHFTEIAPVLLNFEHTVDESFKNETSHKIKKFYFGSADIGRHRSESIIQMQGDRYFVADAERSARLQSAVNSAPVYFMQYGFRGQTSLTYLMSNSTINWGVCHGDDVMLVTTSIHNPTRLPEEEKMSSILLDVYTSFADTGIPKIRDYSETWNPVNPEKTHYMIINGPEDYEVAAAKELGNRKFWDTLPINEPQVGEMPFMAEDVGRSMHNLSSDFSIISRGKKHLDQHKSKIRH